jgi:cellulose synthase/poly-beta-1,6-N-acetylglucosamine synthase-like glycosyltransferase
MRIGVVIPAYNRAALLVETLESILGQNPLPDEIVVVDDGSTDDTAARVEAYGSRGVRYIYQENAGLSAARNTGDASLSPEIEAVLFLDSDDRLLPDALRRLRAALAANPNACLAYGRPRFIGREGEPLTLEWGLEDFEGADLWARLAHRNFICTAGLTLLRRDALHRAGEWDTALKRAEDWDMWLRLAETGAPFVRVTDPAAPVLDYRVHPGTLSRTLDVTLPLENAMLAKHVARAEAAGDAVRAELLKRVIAEREARIAAARTEGAVLEEALLSRKHRLLRRLVERTGLAGLYRRVPLSVRLRMRGLFGVDRWA